jgi:hypothetical protein
LCLEKAGGIVNIQDAAFGLKKRRAIRAATHRGWNFNILSGFYQPILCTGA